MRTGTTHSPSISPWTQRSKQPPIKPPTGAHFQRTSSRETGMFKVTVVEMPGEETGPDAAVMKEATKAVAGGGTIKFDIPHRVRAVYGRQLGVTGANGGYSYVA